MPLLSKIGNSLKACLNTATDFAGTQTMHLLSKKYPDIEDVMEILDKVKDRVKVKYAIQVILYTFVIFVQT